MSDEGITLFYLPPNASYLNPIERMWAFYKSAFSRKLLEVNINGDMDPDNLGDYVQWALEQVADKSTELVKGPLKQMLIVADAV